MKRQYITTAIDFPNAAPHLGHAYEKILADVIARWFRLRGDPVRLHVGTDENGIKIQQTAKGLGITPRELVDCNAPLFKKLFDDLHISYDYFIRTADPQSHWPTVVGLWERLKKNGYLEKRTYHGLYCTGCERFVTDKDLVDGKCPDHGIAPQNVTEENWFFLMSKKQKDIQKLLDPKTGSYRIVPDWRGNEIHSFLAEGLDDVSFSRSKQTLTWGVPVPGDPDQVMYVWCDNLTSYISSLGYFTDHEMREWWDEAEVTDIIGKDIARFHAINWPAMLQCAGVRTLDRLLIHGFITHDGQKMSKTLRNVVDPVDVLKKYNGDPDPLRFFLLHEIPMGNDGDFSWKRMEQMYDAKLRNQLGNLLNRVLVLLKKDGGTVSVPASATDSERARDGWKQYEANMNGFDQPAAIKQAFDLVSALNTGFDQAKPWALKGEEKLMMLSRFAESLRLTALLLLPFMPNTAQKISRQLNVSYTDAMLSKDFVITEKIKEWGSETGWKKVGEPEILFAPLVP